MHTFGNLIQANFRIPCCDYRQLLEVTRILTRNHQDVLESYRRMVFNVLAHNRDDHVKNFAFRMTEAARALLTVLRARGIAVPDAVREHILAQKDPELLERWLEKAAVAASVTSVIDEPN